MGALATVFALGATTLAPADPPATFTADSDGRVVLGDPVTFTATASCEAPVTCTWSGDADFAPETGRQVVGTFDAVGARTVTLTVDDPLDPGAAEVTSQEIVVNRPPQVSFAHVVDGLDVAFESDVSDADAGDELSFAWDFGDGTPVVRDVLHPRHGYAAPGTYRVTLVVSDSYETTAYRESVTVAALNGTPTAAFNFTTDGLTATFDASASSDPDTGDGDALTYIWDFGDSSTATGPVVAHTYAASNRFPVSLTVTDGVASDVIARDVLVNRSPVVTFDWSPATVERGRPVTFTSRASDPDGGELTETWDLDGDGDYDDAFGPIANHTFRDTRTHEVGLRVRDAHGAVTVARLPIVPGNRPPVAAFTVSPERPVAGQILQLSSQSSDSDGTVSSLAWDLDGDGAFDDATGPRAERRVAAAGQITIGLRVVDNDGGIDVVQRRVDVGGAVAEPRPTPPAPSPKLLDPFPSVRVAGRLTSSGAVFRLVTVRAPRGARVAWSCSSKRCRSGSRTAGRGTMRIRALERSFRAGAVLEFRVTRPGRIGKYTRIQVRRDRAPGRRDLCLRSASSRPFACPS